MRVVVVVYCDNLEPPGLLQREDDMRACQGDGS